MTHQQKETSKRKQEHLEICTNSVYNVEMRRSNAFEDIQLIHRALPEIDFEEINLTKSCFGHNFDYPIFLSAITGGTNEAKKINKKIAQIAEKFNIGFCVGSQRAAINDPSLVETYSIVRSEAPSAFISANLGAIQLNNEYNWETAQMAIDMIDANALTLHLNPLQEAIQPEGETNFSKLSEKIASITSKINKPLILKEVGSGFAKEEAEKAIEMGVEGIEVAGAGGTSWAKVESFRAQKKKMNEKNKLGELFAEWGIPTAISTFEVAQLKDKLTIISSGGIRNGIEAAKALAIGGDLVGIALPIIQALSSSTEYSLNDWLNQFIKELKTTMFLIGALNISELQKKKFVVVGSTAQWLKKRGINTKSLTGE